MKQRTKRWIFYYVTGYIRCCLLENLLKSNGVKAKIPGPGVMRAGEGVRAMSWG